jgi:hypothetical protein
MKQAYLQTAIFIVNIKEKENPSKTIAKLEKTMAKKQNNLLALGGGQSGKVHQELY